MGLRFMSTEEIIWGLVVGFGVFALGGVIAWVKLMTRVTVKLETNTKGIDILFQKQKELAKNEEVDVKNLRAELGALKGDIADNKSELKGDINSVKSELKDDINSFKNEIKDEIHKGNKELMSAITALSADLQLHKATTIKKK